MAHILAVDDDTDILLVVEDTLRLDGHEVTVTSRPEEVPRLLAEERIDLIVLDIDMPTITGFEVLKQLREQPLSHAIPVIFLSALGESVYRIEGLRGGAVDYITKPFDPEELCLRVKLGLDRGGRQEAAHSLSGAELDKALLEEEFPPESKLLGRYEPVMVLGRGGGGAVVAVRDPLLRRRAAIKILARPTRSERNAEIEQTVKEATMLAQLNHPGLVQVYDVAVDSRHVFVIMELIEGETLRRRLSRLQRLPTSEFFALACPVVAALSHAHQRGLVHRDITSNNIMLSDEGPRLMDFGLAAFVEQLSSKHPQVVVGTPTYIAPEILLQQPATTLSDIFSLGCVFYEMLTGERPFRQAPGEGANPIMSTLSEDVTPLRLIAPEIPAALAELVQQMLNPVSRRRPTTAHLQQRLAHLATEQPPS